MSAYLQEFKNKEDIEKEYEVKLPDDIEILLAWYGYGSYCGDSFVLFRQNGKLYEVNASHCSCNGLEGQWEPEETSIAALEKRNFYNEYDGYDEANQQLKKIIEEII